MNNHHQVLIVGGGTAGIMVAAQLINQKKVKDVAIIEPADTHYYQPAWTLVGAGTYGVNFGISLSLWDYLFKTNYIPEDSGKVKLGYPGDENLPKDFLGQVTHGFKKRRSNI